MKKTRSEQLETAEERLMRIQKTRDDMIKFGKMFSEVAQQDAAMVILNVVNPPQLKSGDSNDFGGIKAK